MRKTVLSLVIAIVACAMVFAGGSSESDSTVVKIARTGGII